MTKNEIIKKIAEEKLIEKTISNIAKGTYPNTDDLAQDLYIELLEKPEDKLIELYEKKQLNYFITRMVTNNLQSVNSRYYYNYQIWNKNRSRFVNKDEGEKEDTELEDN